MALPALGVAAMAVDAGPAEASKSKGKGPDSPSGFSGQMQVTANIMTQGRVAGLLQVDAGLYSLDQAVRTRFAPLAPVIRSAWRSATQDFANRFHTAGRVPDAVILAQRLQAATDQVLGGTPGAARVLLVSVVAR